MCSYSVTEDVKRVMSVEGISPDELNLMLNRAAITSLRGFNRRYFHWVFKVHEDTVESMQSADMVEVGRGKGKEHMSELCESCNGEGCKECGWVGSILRRI